MEIAKDKKKEEELVVHVMPKRYSKAKEVKQSSSSSNGGLVVVIFGAILMMSFLVFLYFYLVKSDEEEIPILDDFAKEETLAIKNNDNEIKPVIEEEKLDEENVLDDKINLATTTEEEFLLVDVEDDVLDIPTTSIDVINDAVIPTSTINEITVDTDKPIIFDPGNDVDSDGLTDIEEILLGTDTKLVDSDEDGYDDLSEILNLYNPIGAGSIIDNINVSEYVNNEFSYRLYYPVIWSIDKFGGEESIMFKLDNEQFIQVIVQKNEKEQNITDWYVEQVGSDTIKISQLFDKGTWKGIKSENNLIVYLMNDDKKNIFTMTYNLGTKNTLEYKNIFEMMINSLEMIK